MIYWILPNVCLRFKILKKFVFSIPNKLRDTFKMIQKVIGLKGNLVMKRTQWGAPTIAVIVLLVAITTGLWAFHQWRLANFARTKLFQEYHVVSSPSQINIVRIKELGFWYDDFNLFAYHVWEVDFTKPNGPSFGFYSCTVNEPRFGEFEDVSMG